MDQQTSEQGAAVARSQSAFSLLLAGLTLGLLIYLQRSSLLCSVSSPGCRIVAIFGDGLLAILPVLALRMLGDVAYYLWLLLRGRPGRYGLWAEFSLVAFDLALLAYALLRGAAYFLNLDYLADQSGLAWLPAIVPWLFAAALLTAAAFTGRDLYRKGRSLLIPRR